MHLVNGDAWKRKAQLTLKSGFGFSFGFRVFIGGPILWGLFFGFFFFFAFPWVFLGKQQFPYVLDGFGVIFLGFPTKKHVFCFSLVFPRENSSFLTFWTDLA